MSDDKHAEVDLHCAYVSLSAQDREYLQQWMMQDRPASLVPEGCRERRWVMATIVRLGEKQVLSSAIELLQRKLLEVDE